MKYKKTISIILVIIWCSVIFFFSSQNGDSSSSMSNGLLRFIYNYINFGMDIQTFLNTFSYLIRKLAHFTEYFILGLLLYNMFSNYGFIYCRSLSILFGVLYAISDELHQLFSSGRACSIIDVCIDSTGVILSALIFYLIKRNAAKRKSA